MGPKYNRRPRKQTKGSAAMKRLNAANKERRLAKLSADPGSSSSEGDAAGAVEHGSPPAEVLDEPANLSPPLLAMPSMSDSSSTTVTSASPQSHASARSEDEPLPDLVIERDNFTPARGRRLVNIPHLLKQLTSLAEANIAHRQTCTNGHFQLVSEKRSGIVSSLVYECMCCSQRREVSTEEEDKAKAANDKVVWGAMSVGIGHYQTQGLFAVLDVPMMGKQKWNKHEETVGDVWEAKLHEFMRDNAASEKALAVAKGQVDDDGVPFITVIVDGGWSKRSYGHGYDASSGQACIIGAATNGLLYLDVKNKYCYVCSMSKNPGEQVRPHVCYKNFAGPSTRMEQDILVQGFRRSEEDYGLRYLYMVGDGDSSTFAQIQKCVSYGHRIRKLECPNHMVRCYTNKLHKIQTNIAHAVPARQELKARIQRLTAAARGAITSAAIVDVDQFAGLTVQVTTLKADLRNGPYHAFGDHSNCRAKDDGGYCIRKETEVNLVPNMIQSPLWVDILKALEPLVFKADRLVGNVTTNQAERFMGLVAALAGGKRVDHTKRGGYQRRVNAAGLAHMKGPDWQRLPLKDLTGCSPGSVYKKVFEARARRALRVKEALKARRALLPGQRRVAKRKSAAGPDRFYGPEASDTNEHLTDITPEQMEEGKITHMAKLDGQAGTKDARDELQKRTIGQADNVEWIDARRALLTASKFGDVCLLRVDTSCHNTVVKIVHPRQPFSDDIAYGRLHEETAIKHYEATRNVAVVKCGLFVDPIHHFLGASPDGLVGDDGLVEVKCYPKLNRSPFNSFKEACQAKADLCVYLTEDGELAIKPKHRYHFQIQGQIHITGRQYCDLVLFFDRDQEIIRIEGDETFWVEQMLPKLTRFYVECVIPEIVDSREVRGLRARDPSYVKEAQERKAEKKAELEAKKLARQLRVGQPAESQPPRGRKRKIASTMDEPLAGPSHRK